MNNFEMLETNLSVNQQSTTLYIKVDPNSSATREFILKNSGDGSSSECSLHQLPQVKVRRARESENSKFWMNDRSPLDLSLRKLWDFYDEINFQWAYRALDIWLLYLASIRTWGQS